MASKYYLLNIIFWILVIAITAVLTSVVWVGNRSIAVLIGGGVVLSVEVVVFVIRLNAVNRNIASFLNALQNHDTSIKSPSGTRNRTIRELHKSLNHVVSIFQEVKMEFAAREQLFLEMIEHSSTGFISIDDHGDFEIMNQTARNLLGAKFTSNLTRLERNLPELYQIPEPVINSLDVVKWTDTLRSLGLELIPNSNTDLDIVIQDGVKAIQADEGLLNQVMINLINNAVEAPIQRDKKKIKVTIGLTSDGKSVIRVVNDGAPISVDIQDKIFVPVFTSKEHGAGIGLFLCRQIISGHRGSISAFTNQRAETVFEIILHNS